MKKEIAQGNAWNKGKKWSEWMSKEGQEKAKSNLKIGLKGKECPLWKGGKSEFQCKYCNKLFENYKSNNPKYCSKKCFYKSHIKRMSGIKNPFYGKTFSKGSMIKRTESRIKTDGYQAWNKNDNTPIKKAIRGIRKYYDWRKAVFERDNYTCQDCFKKGGKLHAHHIIHVSLIFKEYNIKTIEEALKCEILWDKDNGITLCQKHHLDKHKNENSGRILEWQINKR